MSNHHTITSACMSCAILIALFRSETKKTTSASLTAAAFPFFAKYYHFPARRRVSLYDCRNNERGWTMLTEQTHDKSSSAVELSFSHVHMYVDYVDDIKSYKSLEQGLNQFANRTETDGVKRDELSCRALWNDIVNSTGGNGRADLSNIEGEDEMFLSSNRDVVRQLVSGMGFRVTGSRMGSSMVEQNEENAVINTRSVLVTSCDDRGVQFVITSLEPSVTNFSVIRDCDSVNNYEANHDFFDHFDQSHLHRFSKHYNHRQGIAVLGFEVTRGSIESIFRKYQRYHPNLLMQDVKEYSTAKILEVYAYYSGADDDPAAEKGTLLRFIQQKSTNKSSLILPGLAPVTSTFDRSCYPVYCDHWVSNVISRTKFLNVLNDTLGFTIKANFNAGVVAAGEAQIESTVSGNTPLDAAASTDDNARKKALSDQGQVYLPINNALSSVGHVHWFLKEIGQGVQHIASRVEDLPAFVQRANYYRKVTGEGLTFLDIPRSYYGVLNVDRLRCLDGSEYNKQATDALSQLCASTIMAIMEKSKFVAADGALNLDVSKDEIDAALISSLQPQGIKNDAMFQEYATRKEFILQTILRSRYINLYKLLLNRLSEDSYLKIVRNKILVDVQGNDLLFQIFTCNILQRNSGEEAPFLEFIQRSCSADKFTSGCGGFGIRNFLTLFLSIELSKAASEVINARKTGDKRRLLYYQNMVDMFNAQLSESNPILTEISDAMTLEGIATENWKKAVEESKEDEANKWQREMERCANAKQAGNEKLMHCSERYRLKMQRLRRDNAIDK